MGRGVRAVTRGRGTKVAIAAVGFLALLGFSALVVPGFVWRTASVDLPSSVGDESTFVALVERAPTTSRDREPTEELLLRVPSWSGGVKVFYVTRASLDGSTHLGLWRALSLPLSVVRPFMGDPVAAVLKTESQSAGPYERLGYAIVHARRRDTGLQILYFAPIDPQRVDAGRLPSTPIALSFSPSAPPTDAALLSTDGRILELYLSPMADKTEGVVATATITDAAGKGLFEQRGRGDSLSPESLGRLYQSRLRILLVERGGALVIEALSIDDTVPETPYDPVSLPE